MRNNMPWPTKKLGECLVQFNRGISWSRKDEGGTIAVLRIPNIQEGHINLNDLKYIDTKSKNGELEKDDIVMVASNGNPDLVGRSALVTEKEEGMRFASFLVRLRFDNRKLLPQYAHLFLLTPTFKRELRRKIATTSGIYNLRKQHIEKIKLQLPPLKMQKRIVERLDKIVEAQKLNGGLIQKTEELFQSLLHEELNPVDKNWEVKKLGDVAEVIMGQSPPSSSYNERGEGLPFFQGKAEFGETYPIPIKYCSSPSRIAVVNDILISVRAPVGNINIAKEKSCVGRGLGALRAKKNILNQMFLFYFMKKNENNWSRLSTGSTFSAIKGSSLKNFEIPLPLLKIQKKIAAKLSAVQEYKKQLLEQKSKLKELFDSVLAKSLRGDL